MFIAFNARNISRLFRLSVSHIHMQTSNLRKKYLFFALKFSRRRVCTPEFVIDLTKFVGTVERHYRAVVTLSKVAFPLALIIFYR